MWDEPCPCNVTCRHDFFTFSTVALRRHTHAAHNTFMPSCVKVAPHAPAHSIASVFLRCLSVCLCTDAVHQQAHHLPLSPSHTLGYFLGAIIFYLFFYSTAAQQLCVGSGRVFGVCVHFL
eukprot:Opistho-2@80435